MNTWRIINAICAGLLMTWILCAPICWVIRDGLLGAKASTGWEAVLRFLTTFHWGFIFVMLVIATAFSAGIRKARTPKMD